MTFIAGAYSATYNGKDLGVIDDGFTIEWTTRSEDIITDVGGAVPLDSVYQGVEMTVSFTLAEWNAAGAQDAFWPFHITLGEMGVVGRLMSTLSKPLVLTRCNNAGNATLPNTITFYSAILAPGFNVSVFFGNKLRKVPLQMKLLPVDASGLALDFTACALLKYFATA